MAEGEAMEKKESTLHVQNMQKLMAFTKQRNSLALKIIKSFRSPTVMLTKARTTLFLCIHPWKKRPYR